MLIREVRYSFLMRVTTHEVCECTEGRLCYFRNRCLNSMSSCNPFQLILGKLIFFFWYNCLKGLPCERKRNWILDQRAFALLGN